MGYPAAAALNDFAYHFLKIHPTLRVTPAITASVTDRLWSVEDLVALRGAQAERWAERAVQVNWLRSRLAPMAAPLILLAREHGDRGVMILSGLGLVVCVLWHRALVRKTNNEAKEPTTA